MSEVNLNIPVPPSNVIMPVMPQAKTGETFLEVHYIETHKSSIRKPNALNKVQLPQQFM